MIKYIIGAGAFLAVAFIGISGLAWEKAVKVVAVDTSAQTAALVVSIPARIRTNSASAYAETIPSEIISPNQNVSTEKETPGTSSITVTPSPFTRDLELDSRGDDVKLLQVLLNKSGFTIAESGLGSPGNESTDFGKATARAVQKLHCERGIVCSGTPQSTGYGRVGKGTRDILNALYNLTYLPAK
jgi:hypothetical protein